MRRLMILLCILSLVLASLACDWDWDDDADRQDTGQSADEAIRATETYGAEQFHAQLTAIERDRLTAEGTEEP